MKVDTILAKDYIQKKNEPKLVKKWNYERKTVVKIHEILSDYSDFIIRYSPQSKVWKFLKRIPTAAAVQQWVFLLTVQLRVILYGAVQSVGTPAVETL